MTPVLPALKQQGPTKPQTVADLPNRQAAKEAEMLTKKVAGARSLLISILLASMFGVISCGGGSTTVLKQKATLTMTPLTATVVRGDSIKFTATVSGDSNETPVWTATAGSTVSNGIFFSDVAGTYTVTATITDASISGTVTVTEPDVNQGIVTSVVQTPWIPWDDKGNLLAADLTSFEGDGTMKDMHTDDSDMIGYKNVRVQFNDPKTGVRRVVPITDVKRDGRYIVSFVITTRGLNWRPSDDDDFSRTLLGSDLGPKAGCHDTIITLSVTPDDMNWLYGQLNPGLVMCKGDVPTAMGGSATVSVTTTTITKEAGKGWLVPLGIGALGIMEYLSIPAAGAALCPTLQWAMKHCLVLGSVEPPMTMSIVVTGPNGVDEGNTFVIKVTTNCTSYTLTDLVANFSAHGSGTQTFNVTAPQVNKDTQDVFTALCDEGSSGEWSLTINDTTVTPPTNQFAGYVAEIRPFDAAALTIKNGYYHDYNVEVGNTTTGQEFAQAGVTYQWFWDGADGSQSSALDITGSGKNVRIYSNFTTVGAHTLKVVATSPDGKSTLDNSVTITVTQ